MRRVGTSWGRSLRGGLEPEGNICNRRAGLGLGSVRHRYSLGYLGRRLWINHEIVDV